MFENRKRNKIIILFTLYLISGIIIRVFYLNQFSASPLFNIPLGPDIEEYSKWANNIIMGQLLWDKVHIHSPLYPYFLALLSRIYFSLQNPYFWIRLTQLIIGLFSAIPLFLAMKTMFKKSHSSELPFHKTTMVFFLFLWLFYPPLIYYLGELTSEVLLIPLLSMSLLFLYKWEDYERKASKSGKKAEAASKRAPAWLAGAGIFAGLAVITHPLSLFFIIFEGIYLLIKTVLKKYRGIIRKQVLNFAIFAIAAMLPVLPLVIYNTCILGEKIPLQANSGFNLYLGNGPESDGTCRLRPGPEWDKVHAQAEKNAEKQGIPKDKYFINSTLNHIINNPLKWIVLISKKSLYVWNHREITAGADLLPIRYFTEFQRYSTWSYGFCAVLALIGIILNIGPDIYGRGKNRFFIRYRHFFILILAFWVAQTLLVTSGRYRVGMLPSILILAAAGVSSVFVLLYNFRRRSIIIIPAILIALVIVYLPSPPFHPEKERIEAESLYGEALLLDGRFSEAEQYLLLALKGTPDWTRNYNLLGYACEQQYKFDAAESLYNQAIELDPEDPEGYVNLATLYSSRKLNKSAEEYFNKALEIKIGTPKLHYNYALFCSQKGEEEKAIYHYRECLKLDPANHMSLNNLGTISFQNGKYEEAKEYFKKALLIDPRNAQRILNLSLAYLLSGNPQKAQKTLDRASSIAPNIPEIKTFQSMIDRESQKQK